MWTKTLQYKDEAAPVPNTSAATLSWKQIASVTIPVVLGFVIMSEAISFVKADPTETVRVPISDTRVPQLPINRDLRVHARLVDGSQYIIVVKGRQIDNYEEGLWCDYAWSGKISEIASRAGTVRVKGQYRLDDTIAAREYGLQEAVKFDLRGQKLQSENCTFDVLSTQLLEQK